MQDLVKMELQKVRKKLAGNLHVAKESVLVAPMHEDNCVYIQESQQVFHIMPTAKSGQVFIKLNDQLR